MAYPPPGPRLQKLNALLHQDEAIACIAYACFWIVVFGCTFPIVVTVLLLRLVAQLVSLNRGWAGLDEYDPSKHPDRELAVVITGCDSGFGKEIALRAAETGYVVFAGCLREESFVQFRMVSSQQTGNVIPLKMDVTIGDEVVNAALRVSEWIEEAEKKSNGKKRVLHALLNNAGIAEDTGTDLTPLSSFQRVMDGTTSNSTDTVTSSSASFSFLAYILFYLSMLQ